TQSRSEKGAARPSTTRSLLTASATSSTTSYAMGCPSRKTLRESRKTLRESEKLARRPPGASASSSTISTPPTSRPRRRGGNQGACVHPTDPERLTACLHVTELPGTGERDLP